ncbi:hypothetical protein [Phaeobacter inhibens]|uniref:hypothetical protein n=1 Tax=Phaeobacter inhibens TaxID=221822 RepID=UPI000C9A07AB|nr:hypothetical protein [Phaeobacter inhibens]AUR06985.1 hypothetical protein PhaeoP59_00785 [Phaeobacter inhibens]
MLWRLLTSRIGFAAVLCAALWGWHLYDKRQAVAGAREGLVQEFELTAVQTELDAMRRRMAAAEEANQALREKVQAATGEALRFAAELEAYERETQVNPEGVVDSGLLERLRAN